LNTQDLQQQPDHELVQLFRDGNSAAGNVLAERHFEPLMRTVRGRMGFQNSGTSVAQSTYLVAIEGILAGKFDLAEGKSLFPLLFTIAIRKIADRYRKQGRAARLLDEDPRGHEPEPLLQMETRELIERIREEFPKTERQRKIVNLLLDEHTPAEIAEQIGCTQRYARMVRDELVEALQRYDAGK
jgi:DNA-directed RNA polymerase specialized sigma24 family protein